MGRTKVLHLINGEFFAGAERVQDLLALRLPEFGYDCGFVCLKPGAFEVNRRSGAVPLHTLPMRSKFDVSVVSRVAATLREGGYKILHTHTVRGGLIGRFASRMAGVPMVHHIHSPARRETEQGLRNWVNAVVEERICLPEAARVVAVSNSLEAYLREHGVRPSRISVVPNGVPVLTDTCGWRAPEAEWVLGTVALFRPRKGLEILLHALKDLRDQGLAVRLLAVGGFETEAYEMEMRSLATELKLNDAVEWTGFTRDVGAQLSSMHVFTLPSLFGEGLPMVVIEAMAAGLPVVASRVEGIPEVIGTDHAGVVVEPGDAPSLAAGIASLVNAGPERVRAVAAAGHRRQRQLYSDVAMARAMAGIYAGVLKGDAIPVALAT